MTSFIRQVAEFLHLSQFGILVQQLIRCAMESCIPTGICAGATTRFMVRSGPMRRHLKNCHLEKKVLTNRWFFFGFPMFRTHGCSAKWILSSLGAGYGAQCSSRGVHERNAGEMVCMDVDLNPREIQSVLLPHGEH